MADYNVNMKQWNGTSFDNVLPLAYNAKQLEGQSLAEVKQWVKDNGLLLYTGQYVGTGTYGESNANSVIFPFKPIIFIHPAYDTLQQVLLTDLLTTSYRSRRFYALNNESAFLKKSNDGKTIYWYGDSSYKSFNEYGRTYYFAAIGGYNMASNEYTITRSGTWTVPRTGRYYMELYGGGGAGGSAGYAGGASCQSYDSISLTEGQSFSVTVGAAGYSYSDTVRNGGSTTFGSYSVAGATSSTGWGNFGKGAGNKGVTPTSETDYVYSTGTQGKYYGYGLGGGASGYNGYAGPGAVYLKYLGA